MTGKYIESFNKRNLSIWALILKPLLCLFVFISSLKSFSVTMLIYKSHNKIINKLLIGSV